MRAVFSLPRLSGRWLVLCIAMGCLSCSGGPTLNPAKGTVLYRNQPAPGVVITFHPTGKSELTSQKPSAISGTDGKFSVATGQTQGAPAGEYTVTFFWPQTEASKGKISMDAPPEPTDRLKGAYSDFRSSKITVQIKKGNNQLEPFQLQ